MYYNNKLGFYFKQYGTQIFAVVVCLMIIASGLFLWLKINNRNKTVAPVVAETQVEQTETVEETKTEETEQTNVTSKDDTILSEELQNLKPGEKAVVKVATIDDKGVMVIISGDKRINAKMIGVNFSNELPDTQYNVDQDLSGKNVEISFDEEKTSDGYAMIYIYTDETTLYNAKLIQEGKLTFDSTTSTNALEYNKLAESQAYAKQTLAGLWESRNN